jgi:hypothetical protein
MATGTNNGPDYFEWLFRTITIVMIGVSILSIIVSIDGNIFDKKIRTFTQNKKDSTQNGYKWRNMLNPKTYINFFEEQKKLSDGENIDSIIFEKKDTTTYNHLIVIDRTMSTVFTDTKETHQFCKSLWKSVKNNNSELTKKIDSTDIKKILGAELYFHILNNLSVSFCNVFYDGTKDGVPKFKVGVDNPHLEWISKDTQNKLQVLYKLIEDGIYKNENGQKTDIKQVFKEIDSLCNMMHIILTIVSDFDHEWFKEKGDNNISNTDIEELLQAIKTKPEQINIVYFVPKDETKRKRSDELVKKLRRNIRGTEQNYIEISTERFKDEIFTKEEFINFETALTQCFSYIHCDTIKPIKFYHPRDNKDFNTAECKLKISTEDSTSYYYWRITTPFQQDISHKEGIFKVGHKQSTFDINGAWHKQKISETLLLKFPLTSRIHSEQFNLELVQDRICKRYTIQFEEYIPYSIADLGLLLIYGILLTLFFFVLIYTIYMGCKKGNPANLYGIPRVVYFLFSVVIFWLWLCLWNNGNLCKIIIVILGGCIIIQFWFLLQKLISCVKNKVIPRIKFLWTKLRKKRVVTQTP